MNEDPLYVHRNCFPASWTRRGYLRSQDFEVCDADGTFNPAGGYYKSISTGKVKKLYGACEFEYLPNGDRNPQWAGCPVMDKAEDEVDKLDRLLGEVNDSHN